MKIIHIWKGQEMGTTKVRDKPQGRGSGPRAATARTKGPAANAKKQRARKTTERTLLQGMVDELNKTGGAMSSLMKKTLDQAMAGDKDALAFIGKYMLGNGKVSLDDLTSPPLIKKSR